MGNTRTLEIVSYLIDIVRMNTAMPKEDEIYDRLSDYGYDRDEISVAFNWFYIIADMVFSQDDTAGDAYSQQPLNRILHSMEQIRMGDAVYEHLSRLYNRGFINYRQYENVLHSIFVSEEEHFDVADVKQLIASMMEVCPDHILQDDYINKVNEGAFLYN